MNTKLNVPDQMILIHREFSWRTAWTVNRWFFLAATISLVSEVIFHEAHKHWSLGLRLAILFAEYLAVLLCTRDAKKWIHGMDELHRNITTKILFFAVSASFGFFLLWLRLEREGFFLAVFGPPFWNNTWGIYSVFHVFALLSFFYGIGYLIFMRRYK